MPSLLSAATAIAIIFGTGTGSLERSTPPNGTVRYNKLTYSVRAIAEGSGLGGQNPYCAEAAEDLLMIVYTLRNDSDQDISAPAAPRLGIVSPEGTELKPNARYTQALTNKVVPPLLPPRGVVPARSTILLADVFVTPRAPGGAQPGLASIIYGGWRLRPGRPGTESINLPNPANFVVDECPRPPSLSALRPNESR